MCCREQQKVHRKGMYLMCCACSPGKTVLTLDTENRGIALLDKGLYDITARLNCKDLIVTGAVKSRTLFEDPMHAHGDGKVTPNDNLYEQDPFFSTNGITVIVYFITGLEGK